MTVSAGYTAGSWDGERPHGRRQGQSVMHGEVAVQTMPPSLWMSTMALPTAAEARVASVDVSSFPQDICRYEASMLEFQRPSAQACKPCVQRHPGAEA